MPAKHLDATTAAKVQKALQQHKANDEPLSARDAVQLLQPDIEDALKRGLTLRQITAILQSHMPGYSTKSFAQYVRVRKVRTASSGSASATARRESK